MDLNHLIQVVTDKVMEAMDQQLSSYVLIGENLSTVKDYLTDHKARVLMSSSISDYAESQLPMVIEISTFTSLIRLANLLALNETEEVLVGKMVKGERFLIKYSDQIPANPKLQQKFQQAKRDLQLYGVEVIEEHQLAKYFPELRVAQQTVVNPVSQTVTANTKRQLVTLDIVKNAYESGDLTTFTVERNMIMTALAKDFLREKNIRMVKE